MSRISQYTAWLLLAVFGLILTPKELIHEFYHHEDTACMAGNRPSVEDHHHHCEILQLASLVYTSPGKVTLTVYNFDSREIIRPAAVAGPVSARIYFNLRAPPLV
ncbi:MAG: hypothetical protein WCO44_05395 [Bacteroidota bacterium]